MGIQKYFVKPGDLYGRLTVLSFHGRDGRSSALWNCRCSCGSEVVVVQKSLGSGKTNSCGCYQRDRAKEYNTTHGMEGSRLYSIYWNMRNRCDSPKNKKYHRYGGRGISYHSSFSTFEGFLEGIPEGYAVNLELDRIDNDGDYEPGNLRWVTHRDQLNNMERNIMRSRPDTGESLSCTMMADKFRVHPHTFYIRVRQRDYSVEDAITSGYRDSRPKNDRLSFDLYSKIKDDLWVMDIPDIADWYGLNISEVWEVRNSDSYEEYSKS